MADLESRRKTAHTRVTPNGHAYAVDLRTGDVRDLLPTVEGIRQVAVRP